MKKLRKSIVHLLVTLLVLLGVEMPNYFKFLLVVLYMFATKSGVAADQYPRGGDAQYSKGVSVSITHGCLIKDSGKLYCWGRNNYGGLGVGNTIDSSTPVHVMGYNLATKVTDVAVGYYTTCAIQNGDAFCWGLNNYGQAGIGTNTVAVSKPTKVVGGSVKFQRVFLGKYHACAIATKEFSNKVYCWGLNSSGQLGNASTTNSNVPVYVDPPGYVSELALGDTHSCALTEVPSFTTPRNYTENVKCWGNNSDYQLGIQSVPTQTNAYAGLGAVYGKKISEIKAGNNHNCVLMDSVPYCWGKNNMSQLGTFSGDKSFELVQIPGITNAIEITLGGDSSCANANGLWCWGSNDAGQLQGTMGTSVANPVQISGLEGIGGLSVMGGGAACSYKFGSWKCWGYGKAGNLGDGAASIVVVPAPIKFAPKITGIASGDSFSCALVNGGVKCWGSNVFGTLGNGTNTDSVAPVQVTGLTSGVKYITAGKKFACASTSDKVFCWGANEYGTLGNGTNNPSTVPVEVSGISSEVATLTAGTDHACALLDGTIKCWGRNQLSQLGADVNGVEYSNTPVSVVTPASGVTSVTAKESRTCAIANNVTTCWGEGVINAGAAVQGASSANAVTGGENHSCVIVNNQVKCWGKNEWGQLGNGSFDDSGAVSQSAGTVLSSSGATKVDSNRNYTCAITNGLLRCWGVVPWFESTSFKTASPAYTSGFTKDVTSISAGVSHLCAVVNDTVKCVGTNSKGVLGTQVSIGENRTSAVEIQGLY